MQASFQSKQLEGMDCWRGSHEDARLLVQRHLQASSGERQHRPGVGRSLRRSLMLYSASAGKQTRGKNSQPLSPPFWGCAAGPARGSATATPAACLWETASSREGPVSCTSALVELLIRPHLCYTH